MAVHLLFNYWTVLRKCQELLTVPGVREMFRRSFSGNLCATVCHECFQFGSSTTERLPVLEWFQDVPSSSVCLEATRITWITRAPDITWPCDGLALTRWLVDSLTRWPFTFLQDKPRSPLGCGQRRSTSEEPILQKHCQKRRTKWHVRQVRQDIVCGMIALIALQLFLIVDHKSLWQGVQSFKTGKCPGRSLTAAGVCVKKFYPRRK